jgi:hypothetical protein
MMTEMDEYQDTPSLDDDRNERDEFEAMVRAALSNKPARQFIWHIISQCGVFNDTVEPYEAGVRSVGTNIMNQLMTIPNRFLQTWAENESSFDLSKVLTLMQSDGDTDG